MQWRSTRWAGLRVALDAERQLSQLKSRFVSMVSHEFRTPLGIILSSAEILDAYLDRPPPHERRSNLADITQASRHMAAMREEVPLLSQVEAGRTGFRPAPLPLESFCLRLVDEVASATSGRCPIRCRMAPDLPHAHADGPFLRHILINLLTNAPGRAGGLRPAGLRGSGRVHRDRPRHRHCRNGRPAVVPGLLPRTQCG